MESLATLSRQSREQVQARATAPEAEKPAQADFYVDVTDAQPIPGTRKVALVVRDTRSNSLYVCSRNASGQGRASRLHMDALATLGFVHVSDKDTLAECGYVPKPEDKPAPAKTPAKKAPESK